MGLLHKNLILAGIASVAMVGVLGSSSAFALDGFSFSDVINNYRNQTEQLQLYLTNPFGSGCEATNPGSTISCNETPFPNLLYGASSKENLWGHDGKGIVFANNNNLVNGDPQLATANRGDKLKFSIAVEAENYYDDAKTDPIARYMLGSLNSCGLAVDRSSAIVKVNNQVVSADAYNVELYDIPKEEAEQAGYDFCNEFTISLDWVNESDTLLYAEGSTIEFTYEATIEDDAPSEVFGRGVYIYGSKAGHQEYSSTDFITNTTFQATALLDGNILIRRVDADGNPVEGAKYAIEGVRADKQSGSTYIYGEDGTVSEFETDENGQAIISGLPYATYRIEELFSPDGETANPSVITKDLWREMEPIYYGVEKKIDASVLGLNNIYDAIMRLDDNRLAIDISKITGDKDHRTLTYNSSTDSYEAGSYSVSKHGNDYTLTIKRSDGETHSRPFVYDKTSDKLIASVMMRDEVTPNYYSRFSLNVTEESATFVNGSSSIEFVDNNNNFDCLQSIGEDVEEIYLCQDATGYQLVSPNLIPYRDGIHFIYDVDTGSYTPDFVLYYFSIIREDSDKMVIAPNIAVAYLERFGLYMLSGLQKYRQAGLPYSENAIYVKAAEYLFAPGKNTSPETITNPQTGDAVIKTIIIVVAGLAPVLMLRKRLTRR